VLAVAMIITLVTVLFSVFVTPKQEIYFGILHFMAVAILLYIPLRKPLDRIPPAAALAAYTLLFVFTFRLPSDYILGLPGIFTLSLPQSVGLLSQDFSRFLGGVFHTDMPEWFANVVGLYPFGLPQAGFESADYFPLLPWIFVFLAGTVLGVPVKEHKLPEWFYTARVPFFAAAGRNTLLIYVLHQPVIYCVLLIIMAAAGR
jgi:uncharacterized membrane protein